MQIPSAFFAGKFDFSNAGAPEEMQHLLADTESIPWRRRKYEQVRRSRGTFPNDQDLVCPAYSCSYGQLTPPRLSVHLGRHAMVARSHPQRAQKTFAFFSVSSKRLFTSHLPSGSDFCGTGEARQGAGSGGQRRRLVVLPLLACSRMNQ